MRTVLGHRDLEAPKVCIDGRHGVEGRWRSGGRVVEVGGPRPTLGSGSDHHHRDETDHHHGKRGGQDVQPNVHRHLGHRFEDLVEQAEQHRLDRVAIARVHGESGACSPSSSWVRTSARPSSSSASTLFAATTNGTSDISVKNSIICFASSNESGFERVDQQDEAEHALGEGLPHEREARLTRRSEEIEHDIVRDGDASEVHRDGGLALALGRGVADLPLGREHGDLADRLDERRLTGVERAGHHDLDGLHRCAYLTGS